MCAKRLLLLVAGADVSATDEDGWTPPHCVCDERPKKAVETAGLMLRSGADEALGSSDGDSPEALLLADSDSEDDEDDDDRVTAPKCCERERLPSCRGSRAYAPKERACRLAHRPRQVCRLRCLSTTAADLTSYVNWVHGIPK